MTTRKSLPTDLIDSLLADYKKPEDLIGENGLLKQLTKALVERAVNQRWNFARFFQKTASNLAILIYISLFLSLSFFHKRRWHWEILDADWHAN